MILSNHYLRINRGFHYMVVSILIIAARIIAVVGAARCFCPHELLLLRMTTTN
jgi:hypothetical protein